MAFPVSTPVKLLDAERSRVMVEPYVKAVNASPDTPDAPAGPVAPVAPVGPVGPVAPVAPVGPVGPVAPVAPVGPVMLPITVHVPADLLYTSPLEVR